ncbi:glycosyl transferase group 1 [Ancylobacter novellus DSM 506]|uniref:Glycosyl transferase group 1 n=1 Tax=Ancylobacter novellus (strain ATCC 8093 / DSM 506 / JCM 20403 / CCM 1077 / IAM 12100 / NBRC 12443 / NCIMB 10456) TaxID=639283 RepID=D7A832_ANCN5|nr:glycosyltransferase family 4 protein [Ancylobacter novellus]ADH90490.1 glycosyl transferase group 1 [Ancylobacter novellus DSM 506]
MIALSAMDFRAPGATQARQANFLRALASQGAEVALINPARRPPPDLGFPVVGLPAFARRLPWRLALAICVMPLLISQLRRARQDLLVFSTDPQLLLQCLVVARLFRVRILHEITEYPSEVLPCSLYGRFSLWFWEKVFVRAVDRQVVISRALRAYVEALNPHAAILTIPATTVFGAREEWEPRGGPFTFVYTGSLNERKDGVLSLVAAFRRLFEIYPDSQLDMYGHGYPHEAEAVREMIDGQGLAGIVRLHAAIPSSEVPAVLHGASALVLCRPSSKQATGGFPTKLAEYLAAGRPVVVTQTGDIGLYLEDGVSAYLVPPDSVEAFAEGMRRVVDDPAQAERIGRVGWEVGRRHMDVEAAARRFLAWIGAPDAAGPVGR